MKERIVLLAMSFFIMISYASAGDFKNINAAELKTMLDKKTKIAVVDARPAAEYSQGHVPKAVNVPPEKVGTIGTFLPKNKKTLLAFYCRGVG